MVVDSTAFRRKARREYDKTLHQLDEAKADVERFEVEDKPKFEKWLSANFGAILTEIRELQEKLFHAQGLVNEVQQEFYFGDYRSVTNAYKKVMHRRAHPEEFDEGEKAEAQDEEQDFRRNLEEEFGKAAEEFWARLGIDPNEVANKRPAADGAEGNRLKDRYRRLVRRLHPDKNGKRSPKEIEWWHQAQEAYQSGNVEQLELILTLVEMDDKGSTEASVSVLAQLTAEFKKSLRSLKRKLSAFKREAAWNFSRLTDFAGLMERMHQQLVADRDEVLWHLEKYEKQIKSWDLALASSVGKRVRAGRGAWQDEEWF